MAEYIELEAAVKAFNNFDAGRADSPPFTLLTPEEFAEYLYELPTANVAPIEALERLRDELYEQDLITMEGLKRLNTLIGKYTTARDGGLAMAEYIDREEYCEKHCRCSNEYCDKESCPIWKAPAADVAPVVHTRWAHLSGDEWCCPVCGFVITTEGSWDKPTKKYCEDCGAKMDGGADNEAD